MSHLPTSLEYQPDQPAIGRPTRVRWRMLALLMAYSAMCHFNRVSMSVAGTERIMEEYAIRATRMGAVYSAYLVVYTLMMTPGGWLIDRYGPRTALGLMGFGSAVFVPLTGLTGLLPTAGLLFGALLLVRGILGFASAPMHPAAARVVSFWIPGPRRASANGLITGSALVGIASTYWVFGLLIDHCGWQVAFVIAGLVTLLVAGLWTAYSRDHPAGHRSVNAEEAQWIQQSTTDTTLLPGPAAVVGPTSLWTETKLLLGNRSLIWLTISYAAVGYFEYLFFYWMQFYFDKVLAFGKEQGRLYATMATLAMAVGMALGGWLTDRSQAYFGQRRGRALVPVSGMVASALLLVLGTMSREPAAVVSCFALAAAAVGSCEAAFWVTGIDLGGRRGGTSAAILNTGGNAGGVLAPVVTPLFSDYFGWQASLSLASGFCLLGAALWWWIDPAER